MWGRGDGEMGRWGERGRDTGTRGWGETKIERGRWGDSLYKVRLITYQKNSTRSPRHPLSASSHLPIST